LGVFRNIVTDLSEFFSHQEESRLIWPAVFLGLGSAIFFTLSFEPPMLFALMALLTMAIMSAWQWRLFLRAPDNKLDINYLIYLACIACLLTATGFAVSKVKSDLVGTPMVSKETRVVKIEAMLTHIEDRGQGKGKQLQLSNLEIEKWEKHKTPKSIRITTRTKISQDVSVGDRVSFLAKLTPPSSPIMPGSFDYARHFYFESIGGLGYAVSDIELIEKNKSMLPDLDNIRGHVSQIIKSHVAGPTQGIVVALMTGERAAIDESDWQALRASGLAHIISISGLHVAMVAAPVFFCVRLLLSFFPVIALSWNIKKISALIALIVCAAYVGFVVPSVPTTRALLMTGVALIAIMLDRSPFSLRLVGASAVLILLISPESIWSASFQMSFAAVAAIIALADWTREFWLRQYREAGWIKKSFLYLAGATLTSLIASLATAPFVWYHFQQMATYSVIGNLLAMPLSGLIIMPMLILSYILMPFGLEGATLHLMSWGVEQLLNVARLVQSLPHALITGPYVSPLFLYFMTMAALIILLFKGKWKWIALPTTFIAVLCAWSSQRPEILVSESGELILVRNGEDSALLSSSRKEKFTAEQWMQYLGIKEASIFPREGTIETAQGDIISCDLSLCRITTGKLNISYGVNYSALHEDCGWADIIIAPKWLDYNFCKRATVVDLGFLRGSGAISIARDGGIRGSSEDRKKRPWGN
jgi:competence protein ComEC